MYQPVKKEQNTLKSIESKYYMQLGKKVNSELVKPLSHLIGYVNEKL